MIIKQLLFEFAYMQTYIQYYSFYFQIMSVIERYGQ